MTIVSDSFSVDIAKGEGGRASCSFTSCVPTDSYFDSGNSTSLLTLLTPSSDSMIVDIDSDCAFSFSLLTLLLSTLFSDVSVQVFS